MLAESFFCMRYNFSKKLRGSIFGDGIHPLQIAHARFCLHIKLSESLKDPAPIFGKALLS